MPIVESVLHTLRAWRRMTKIRRTAKSRESSTRCPRCSRRSSKVTAVVNVILLLYRFIDLTAHAFENTCVFESCGHNPDTCIVCCTGLPTPCERLDRFSYTPSRQTDNDNNRTLTAVLIRDICIIRDVICLCMLLTLAILHRSNTQRIWLLTAGDLIGTVAIRSASIWRMAVRESAGRECECGRWERLYVLRR